MNTYIGQNYQLSIRRNEFGYLTNIMDHIEDVSLHHLSENDFICWNLSINKTSY